MATTLQALLTAPPKGQEAREGDMTTGGHGLAHPHALRMGLEAFYLLRLSLHTSLHQEGDCPILSIRKATVPFSPSGRRLSYSLHQEGNCPILSIRKATVPVSLSGRRLSHSLHQEGDCPILSIRKATVPFSLYQGGDCPILSPAGCIH